MTHPLRRADDKDDRLRAIGEGEMGDAIGWRDDKITQLTAENARLREAARPFARIGAYLRGDAPDSELWRREPVLFGEIRALRLALNDDGTKR